MAESKNSHVSLTKSLQLPFSYLELKKPLRFGSETSSRNWKRSSYFWYIALHNWVQLLHTCGPAGAYENTKAKNTWWDNPMNVFALKRYCNSFCNVTFTNDSGWLSDIFHMADKCMSKKSQHPHVTSLCLWHSNYRRRALSLPTPVANQPESPRGSLLVLPRPESVGRQPSCKTKKVCLTDTVVEGWQCGGWSVWYNPAWIEKDILICGPWELPSILKLHLLAYKQYNTAHPSESQRERESSPRQTWASDVDQTLIIIQGPSCIYYH